MLNLVAQGPWSPAQVIASTIPSSRPIIPEIQDTITQTWHEHQSRLGAALFDGPMARLESFKVQSDNLHLNLSTTSYRIFLGTNLCHADLAQQFGRPVLANAIGMSAALVTADNKLVMGRRNDRVAYYPNRIHPFAGALEPRDVPNIFDGMRRELAEELNLQTSDVSDLRMLAIIEDQRLLQPEFIFATGTRRSAADLIQSLDLAEHRALWSCDVSASAMDRVMDGIDGEGRSTNDHFTPVGVGTLLTFGRQFLGDSWAESHRRFFRKEKDAPRTDANAHE